MKTKIAKFFYWLFLVLGVGCLVASGYKLILLILSLM